jgi:protein-disulfide isomerase
LAAVFGLAVAGAQIPPAPPVAEAPASAPVTKEQALAPKAEDIGMGDPNAPVKWVEYASAGCGHCAAMTLETLPKVKAAYIDTGKVYYVLRDFPLDNLSLGASVLARCLPKEKFHPFMETVFARQKDWRAPEVTDPGKVLIAMAGEAGLTPEAADACLKDRALFDRIVATRTEAETVLGVNSTPTSFINGEATTGAVPFEAFEKLLKAALGE